MKTIADLNKTNLDVYAAATSPFRNRARKYKLTIYAVTLYKIDKALGIKYLQDQSLKNDIPKEDH
jgi:hypothetical protein